MDGILDTEVKNSVKNTFFLVTTCYLLPRLLRNVEFDANGTSMLFVAEITERTLAS